MAIVAECAVCGKRFRAAETQAGKKAKCSQCGTVFVIAAATGSSEPAGKVGALAPDKSLAARPQAGAPVSMTSKVAAPAPAKVVSAAPAKVASVKVASGAPSKVVQPHPARVPTPTKVTASRARSAVDLDAPDLSPELKPAPQSQSAARALAASSAIEALPATTASAPAIAPQPAPARKNSRKLISVVVLLLIVAGSAILVVPKLFPKPPSSIATTKSGDSNNAQIANHVISPSLPPTGPAWNVRPDVAAPGSGILKLPEDFRLAIPAQPPLRHNPSSLVLAPAPSPFLAVTLLPNADRSQPTIEVWNLYTKAKTAQFKLNQPLTNALLSQDGGYYAGQFYDQDARATRVEIWSTSTGTRIHTVDIPSAAPLAARAALGFPLEDQMALIGDKLQVWNLPGKKVVREVELPPRSQDTCAAASAKLKLVAVADSKVLTMVDLAGAKVLGNVLIPEALVTHPQHRLSLRALEFSPDGSELALLFDNHQSTRRIGVFDVATGVLKALHTPVAPLQAGGPDFQWTGDSQAFLVGSGVLLDRAAGRQIGQIYTEKPEEGLGGTLGTLLADDRVLAVWDKYPNSLVLRSLPVQREKPDWVSVNITSAVAKRYEQLQCVSREFGNLSPVQSLFQSGRLTDGSQFLVVDTRFTASLTDDAPKLLSLRPDRFVLLADGQPHLPIGSISRDGNFSLEKPQSDLRRGDSDSRSRSIVFAISGREKSLALQIASAEMPLELPALSVQSPPSLSAVAWEQGSLAQFASPDDSAQVSVRVTSARIGPYELDPQAAEHVPLRVTYSTTGASVMAVTFEMTVNTARNFTRTSSPQPPRLGLFLPNGKIIRPAIELPDHLPITLGAGERRTHTCLFIFNNATTNRFRLTYDGVPVATILPEASTAQSSP